MQLDHRYNLYHTKNGDAGIRLAQAVSREAKGTYQQLLVMDMAPWSKEDAKGPQRKQWTQNARSREALMDRIAALNVEHMWVMWGKVADWWGKSRYRMIAVCRSKDKTDYLRWDLELGIPISRLESGRLYLDSELDVIGGTNQEELSWEKLGVV